MACPGCPPPLSFFTVSSSVSFSCLISERQDVCYPRSASLHLCDSSDCEKEAFFLYFSLSFSCSIQYLLLHLHFLLTAKILSQRAPGLFFLTDYPFHTSDPLWEGSSTLTPPGLFPDQAFPLPTAQLAFDLFSWLACCTCILRMVYTVELNTSK